jgi:hypothetical protein
MREQASAETTLAELRIDEEVLEVEPGAREEGGIRAEPERVTGGRVAVEREHDFRDRVRAEQGLLEQRFRRHAFVGEALVLGEGADPLQDEGHVGRRGRAETEVGGLGGRGDATHGRQGQCQAYSVLEAPRGNR